MSEFRIYTNRLLVRPIEKEDAKLLFAYRSNVIENMYQGWIPGKIEDVYDFINDKISPSINIVDTWYQLTIIEKETNVLIGDIGLHFIDAENKQVEIGCTLNKEYQGKGYATEALEGIIDYLFMTLNKHRIMASVDPRNHKSLKLLERIGFRKEAHFKKSLFINNEWVDDIIYAILQEEWNR